jgi:hypothetical protein
MEQDDSLTTKCPAPRPAEANPPSSEDEEMMAWARLFYDIYQEEKTSKNNSSAI